jgi:putative transposase
VRSLCRVMEVSPGGYYAWHDRPQSLRRRANEEVVEQIKAIFEHSRETYGSPRVHFELAAQGVRCGRKRIASRLS